MIPTEAEIERLTSLPEADVERAFAGPLLWEGDQA